MTKISTTNEIVRSLYEDLTPQEKREIENTILTEQLEEIWDDFNHIKKLLNEICIQPSLYSLNKILHFSKNYDS